MTKLFSFSRLAVALLFAFAMMSAQAHAQRYLTERLGLQKEARAVSDFGNLLAGFSKKSDTLLKKERLTRDEIVSLENSGKSVIDGSSNTAAALQLMIKTLKQNNQWNEQLDADFLAAVKSSNGRAILAQAGGARKLLEGALNDANSVRDVVNTNVNEAKTKLVAANRRAAREEVFTAHAFKKGFKCFLLGAGLVISEAAGLDRVACRVDEAFGEAGCGGKKPCGDQP